MKNRILYFVLLFVFWLLITWSLDSQNIIAGLIASFIVSAALGHLFFDNIAAMLNPRRIFWFLYYIPFFGWHIVKANFDVAYRVLHANVPIRPGIVKVHTTMTSDLGLTFLANSITLTPGTLTVDIIGNEMFIHWIYIHTDDPEKRTEMIVSRFENILKKVFE